MEIILPLFLWLKILAGSAAIVGVYVCSRWKTKVVAFPCGRDYPIWIIHKSFTQASIYCRQKKIII